MSTNKIVAEAAEVSDLKLTGLAQSNANANTFGPLTINSLGSVSIADNISLKKAVINDIQTEKLHVGSDLTVDLSNFMKSPIDITHSPLLTLDRQGHVTAVSSIAQSSITTSTLKVSNNLEVNAIQVGGFTFTPTVTDPFKVLIAEGSGVISTRKLSDLSIPLPQIISVSELKVSGSTTVHNLNIANSEAGVLSIDSIGTVRSVQNVKVKALESDTISVPGTATVDKLIIKGTSASVLSTDSYGNVVPVPGVSLQDSNLRIRLVRIGQLNGDLDVNGYKIQKANLVESTISDSDISVKGTVGSDGAIITANKVSLF